MSRWSTLAYALWRRPAHQGSMTARWSVTLLVVLVAASVGLWFAIVDMRKQLERVQEVSALTLQRTQALSPASISITTTNARSLQGFQSNLPESTLREQRILGLLVLASRYGLQVKQASLQALAPDALTLQAYEVALPTVGTYISLRSFMDEALRSDPGLALRSVKLQRKDSMTDIFEAQLVFTLWMQEGVAQ